MTQIHPTANVKTALCTDSQQHEQYLQTVTAFKKVFFICSNETLRQDKLLTWTSEGKIKVDEACSLNQFDDCVSHDRTIFNTQ